MTEKKSEMHVRNKDMSFFECAGRRLRGAMTFGAVLAAAALGAEAFALDGTASDDGVYEYRISSRDLNCISFPFESISINTASDAEIEIKNGSLYVMPLSDEPITVFVTPADVSGWNAMLRLIPADINPRHIRIKPESVSVASRSRDGGKKFRGEYPSEGKSSFGMTSAQAGGYGKAFGRTSGVSHETTLVSGFRTVWEHLMNGGSSDDDGITVADLSSFADGIPKLCGLSEERTVDAFYVGDFLYLVILVNDEKGRNPECGGDVLAYAMLNTMKSFKDTDRILLAALPRDYDGTVSKAE